jgi:hypothetical protein
LSFPQSPQISLPTGLTPADVIPVLVLDVNNPQNLVTTLLVTGTNDPAISNLTNDIDVGPNSLFRVTDDVSAFFNRIDLSTANLTSSAPAFQAVTTRKKLKVPVADMDIPAIAFEECSKTLWMYNDDPNPPNNKKIFIIGRVTSGRFDIVENVDMDSIITMSSPGTTNDITGMDVIRIENLPEVNGILGEYLTENGFVIPAGSGSQALSELEDSAAAVHDCAPYLFFGLDNNDGVIRWGIIQ